MNKINIIITQIIIWVMIFNWSCGTTVKHVNSKSLKALALNTSLPILDEEENLQKFERTIILFEYSGTSIYEVPVINSFSKINLDKQGNMINQEFIKFEKTFLYYIYSKGEPYGLKYDSVLDLTGNKFSVDSLLSNWTITTFEPFYSKKKSNDSLINSIWLKNGDFLTEYYIPRQKKDESYPDSTILKFSNELKDFNFSLSRQLDSLRGIKLSHVRMVYNNNPKAKSIYGSKAREILYEIKRIPVANESQLYKLIKVFKREILSK